MTSSRPQTQARERKDARSRPDVGAADLGGSILPNEPKAQADPGVGPDQQRFLMSPARPARQCPSNPGSRGKTSGWLAALAPIRDRRRMPAGGRSGARSRRRRSGKQALEMPQSRSSMIRAQAPAPAGG